MTTSLLKSPGILHIPSYWLAAYTALYKFKRPPETVIVSNDVTKSTVFNIIFLIIIDADAGLLIYSSWRTFDAEEYIIPIAPDTIGAEYEVPVKEQEIKFPGLVEHTLVPGAPKSIEVWPYAALINFVSISYLVFVTEII